MDQSLLLMSRLLRASTAVVRQIPPSVATGLRISTNGPSGVNVQRARRQHDEYVSSLERILKRDGEYSIHAIEFDEKLPDCCFVEDTVVVMPGERAMLTRPKEKSRRDEILGMRHCLDELGLSVETVNSKLATIDGGDVLFTGDAYFVGLSRRTNEAGASALRAAARGVPVIDVPMQDIAEAAMIRSQSNGSDFGSSAQAVAGDPEVDGDTDGDTRAASVEGLGATLHLKSALTLASEDVIIHGPEPAHAAIAAFVQEKLSDLRGGAAAAGELAAARWDDIKTVRVGEMAGANVVLCNGAVLCRSRKECPKAFAELDRMRSAGWIEELIEVEASEVEKIDGALSCCSVLIWN